MATLWMQINTDEYAKRGDAYIQERIKHYQDEAGYLGEYVAGAKETWQQDGEIEIDDDACVSISEDGGAYVQAWVWVTDEAAGVDRESEEN